MRLAGGGGGGVSKSMGRLWPCWGVPLGRMLAARVQASPHRPHGLRLSSMSGAPALASAKRALSPGVAAHRRALSTPPAGMGAWHHGRNRVANRPAVPAIHSRKPPRSRTCWFRPLHHPGDNPGANLKSISHRCHPILVAFVWELTEETIYLPLGCLQGGLWRKSAAA